jgi:hypothetical protein
MEAPNKPEATGSIANIELRMPWSCKTPTSAYMEAVDAVGELR